MSLTRCFTSKNVTKQSLGMNIYRPICRFSTQHCFVYTRFSEHVYVLCM